jgi:hypothetical protein
MLARIVVRGDSKPNWKTGSGGERQPDAPRYLVKPTPGRFFLYAQM